MTVLLCPWPQEFQLDIKSNIFTYEIDSYAPFNKKLVKSIFAYCLDCLLSLGMKINCYKQLEEEHVYTYINIISSYTLFLEIIIFSLSFYNVPLLVSIFEEGHVNACFNS
jgi:hypothetical protein